MDCDPRLSRLPSRQPQPELSVLAPRRVRASGHSGISVFITMTTTEYDNIRKNLLSMMQACPKDLEIQSLKEQLQRAWER